MKVVALIMFCSLLFFKSQFLLAQSKKQDEVTKETIIFHGNHFKLDFGILSVLKAQLRPESGNYSAGSTMTAGLLLSLKYQINFDNYYSLITGPEAVLSGRNFNVGFRKDDFSPPLIQNYHFQGVDTYLADLILSLPVLLERRILFKKTKYLFADAGCQLNVSTGADYDILSFYVEDINNNIYNVAEVNVYANNNAKPWISFLVNAGQGWLLKNNNVLQLAFAFNISFTKYVNGAYQITIPNKPTIQGRYSSTGSFIGLSLNYVFTSANYRIRKQYEKRMQN